MKQKIVGIDRSPFNRQYMLTLDCGHTKWVKRKPLSKETDCEECKKESNK